MNDIPHNGLALAVGELKGGMDGIKNILENQNKASEGFREEIRLILKEMRDASVKQGDMLAAHIKDDEVTNRDVAAIKIWKEDAQKKISTLWDANNTQGGLFTASKIFIASVWSAVLIYLNYMITKGTH